MSFTKPQGWWGTGKRPTGMWCNIPSTWVRVQACASCGQAQSQTAETYFPNCQGCNLGEAQMNLIQKKNVLHQDQLIEFIPRPNQCSVFENGEKRKERKTIFSFVFLEGNGKGKEKERFFFSVFLNRRERKGNMPFLKIYPLKIYLL